jgi:hypothetical protein
MPAFQFLVVHLVSRGATSTAVLLGVISGVAELIAELSLTDRDTIVEWRFQHLLPDLASLNP